MFQDVAEFWKVLVREDFYMHQFMATTQSNVGVSLLAITVCQAANTSTDKPLSRAGSLLQGGFVVDPEEGITRYCPALASA
jgi:hypothetical protein